MNRNKDEDEELINITLFYKVITMKQLIEVLLVPVCYNIMCSIAEC